MDYTLRHKVIMTALFPLGPIVFALVALLSYYLIYFLLAEWWFAGTSVDVQFLAIAGALAAGGLAALAINSLIWARKPEEVSDVVAYFPLIGLLSAGIVFFLIQSNFSEVTAFLISLVAAAIVGAVIVIFGLKLINIRSESATKVF